MTFQNVTDLELAFNAFRVAFESVASGELKKLLSNVAKGKSDNAYLSEFLFDSAARKNGNLSINASSVAKCVNRIKSNAFYINDKKTKGLFFMIRGSTYNISAGFVYRYVRNGKVESISLELQDYKDLDNARLKAKELSELVKSAEFKESVLSLKEYLEKKKAVKTINIKRLFSEWSEKKTLREKTRYQYQNVFINYIIPYFDKIDLNKVNLDFIRVWLEKVNKHRKDTFSIFSFCKSLFQYATHKQYIARNVFNDYCYKLDFKKYEPTNHEKFSEYKLLELLNFNRNGKKLRGLEFKDSMQGKILRFMIYMPLRIGNVMLLEWQEVDLEKRLIKIKKDKMKNKRDFVIPINNEAYKILKEMEKVKISEWVFDKRLEKVAYERRLYNAIKEVKELRQEAKKVGKYAKHGSLTQIAKKYKVNLITLKIRSCDDLQVPKYYHSKLSKDKQLSYEMLLQITLFNRMLKIHAHSFRGTFATLVNDNLHKIVNSGFNVSREIVGMCLAHDKKDIESVYSVSQMIDSKRLILDFWNNFLDNLQGKNEAFVNTSKYANRLNLRASGSDLFTRNVESGFLGGFDSSELESSDDDTLSF